MQTLNYTVLENGIFTQKVSIMESTYDILKDELNQATLGAMDLLEDGELTVWFDDEFLLKEEKPVPTLIVKNELNSKITDKDIVFCGKLLFCSTDNEGETKDITEKGLQELAKFLTVGLNNGHKVHMKMSSDFLKDE